MGQKIKLLLLLAILFQAENVISQNTGHNRNPLKSFDLRVKRSNSHINDSNVRLVIKKQFSIPNDYELVAEDVRGKRKLLKEADNLGYMHERFIQYYKGIRVENSDIRVHYKNDSVVSANGDYVDLKGIDITPTISKEKAIEYAKNYVKAQKYIWEDANESKWLQEITKDNSASFYPNPQLVISKNYLNPEDTGLYLSYKVDIYAKEPLSRDYIYVNAKSGEIINSDAIIKYVNATAATRYSGSRTISTQQNGSTFRLRDYDNSRGNGIETYNLNHSTTYSSATDFSDADNNWTSGEYHNTNKDDGALDAHWGAMMTYDYFRQIHGRNSYDNNGAIIRSYVHYSSSYENAFWNGSVMTYGDGSTNFDILTSLDVAAHEIGHAVCTNTANLAYQNESGAINEGLSDIWAACVENYAAPAKQIWLIGEDIDIRSGHDALRSMSNPNSESQPDTYGGTNWISQTGCTPSRTNDYCGVHTNSGVMNYWFYLLSVGGSGTNDINNVFNVSGIGIDKAARIMYRAESVYMTANNNFSNVRTHTIQAAIDLYGDCSQEVISTANAWYAVGVGTQYTANQVVSNVTYVSNTTINACNVELNNVKVRNGAKLKIDAAGGVTINGEFEVELGSELEIK